MYNNYIIKIQKEEFPTLYNHILSERDRLILEQQELQKQLKNYPNGDLVCHKNGNYYRWRVSTKKKQKSIKKSNTSLLTSMAEKKYLSSKSTDLQQEIEACNLYLSHFSPETLLSSSILTSPHYRPFLESYFHFKDDELQSWANASYQRNPLYPEQLIHHSASGNMVRSKSEALIDMALFKNHLPFRYECILQLGDHIFYPDFTILHPITKQIYYWEHCGLMDEANYVNKLYTKLPVYNHYGIIQTINLITTYETLSQPLDSTIVDDIINHYFLS